MEAEDDNIEIVTITRQCRACLIFEAENFVRISSRSVDAAASGFGLESKATETYDMMGTIAMTNNNVHSNLAHDCCLCHCNRSPHMFQAHDWCLCHCNRSRHMFQLPLRLNHTLIPSP